MIRFENVLKRSLQDVLKTSWRRLQNVLKMSWRPLEKVLNAPWRCFEDVVVRRLEDVLKSIWRRLGKRLWRRLKDILKASWRRLEDVWPRHYVGLDQGVLKTCELGEYIDIDLDVLKTSWRRLLKTKRKDVLKTRSSRRIFAGKWGCCCSHPWYNLFTCYFELQS